MVYLYLFFTVPFCGRGSVSVWRRCDTLCTSGFMDDVMLVRNSQEWATPETYIQTYSVRGSTNLTSRCILELASRGQHRNGGVHNINDCFVYYVTSNKRTFCQVYVKAKFRDHKWTQKSQTMVFVHP